MAERFRAIALDGEVRGPREAIADQWRSNQPTPVESDNGDCQGGNRQHAADIVQRACPRITVGTEIAEPEVAVRHDGTSVIAVEVKQAWSQCSTLIEIALLRSQ